jgi:hypothetical protein
MVTTAKGCESFLAALALFDGTPANGPTIIRLGLESMATTFIKTNVFTPSLSGIRHLKTQDAPSDASCVDCLSRKEL